jgi:hypothetical protein
VIEEGLSVSAASRACLAQTPDLPRHLSGINREVFCP